MNLDGKATLTEEVVARIQDLISSRNLNPGDVLATESQLQSELGASRSIVREAVSRLKSLGILTSKQRVGLVVTEPDPVAVFGDSFSAGGLSNLSLQQIVELRYVLEIGAVELVARRATDEQLQKLLDLAAEFSRSPEHKYSGRSEDEIELDFHEAILQAAGNDILSRMHSVIAAYFAKAPHEIENWDPHGFTESSAWEHKAIAQALVERNTERARALLTSHLNSLLI